MAKVAIGGTTSMTAASRERRIEQQAVGAAAECSGVAADSMTSFALQARELAEEKAAAEAAALD